MYEKKLKSFAIEFKSDISLRDIKDASYTFIPKDCELKQMAYKSNVIGESHQLFINNDYWKKLTPVNQAALLMHEAIYDHFKFFNQTNSKSARKLVGMIFSNDFENRTHADLKQLFLDARIPLD